VLIYKEDPHGLIDVAELYQAELTSQILETNADEDVWLTKDGREFKIKDMDTMHIINTLNFLKRNDDYFTLELYEQKFKEELRNRGMYL
jgi:hypothetical protein